jgi:protein SDA1
MAYMNKRASVTMKLPQLQNLIKRDPAAYREEFMMQKSHFSSELDIFKLRPTMDCERFTDLVSFMSHTINCYLKDCSDIPTALIDLLETHSSVLHPDVRSKLFQALVIMRKRDVVEPLVLIKLSFKLFAITDKSLRAAAGEYIMADIKALNSKKHNDKINKNIQATLFNIVTEDTTITARKTVEILSELYRKRIWTDARTVNVIGSACVSSTTRVAVTAINFFLGIETKMMEDDEEEFEGKSNIDFHEHSKKTKKRARDVKKQREKNDKKERDHVKKLAGAVPLFPAIQLLHDPQSLAEKLFKRMRQTGDRFEVKLLMMNFVSRLIGCHKLLMLSYYSFLQRYLTSHQKDVTLILAYLIQACHELVPPEDLLPVIKSIAQNFITERCSNEVVAVGINSVREILARVPSVLHEPGMDDFVQDLALYSRKTHKSVMTAAHGLVNLVR